MLSLEEMDRLLLTWDERLRRIEENLLAIESDPAYLTLIGPGSHGRYDGISKQRLDDVQQELSALFADLSRLRSIIEQAHEAREAIRGKLWGKEEKLSWMEGLLLGPSISRGDEPRPLEDRSLLDSSPHARSIRPEVLLNEMILRFDEAKRILLSVWNAWKQVEPSVQKMEEQLRLFEVSASQLHLASGSLDGLVSLRAEVARLRSLAARDPLTAPQDLETHLTTRYQILRANLQNLRAHRDHAREHLVLAQKKLTELQHRSEKLSKLTTTVFRNLALGPEAPSLAPDTAPLEILSRALEALHAPGAWLSTHRIDAWFADATVLQNNLVRTEITVQKLLDAGPELAGRFSARRAQLSQFQARGYRIPEEVVHCIHTIEGLLAEKPLPVGRVAAYMELLDNAMR